MDEHTFDAVVSIHSSQAEHEGVKVKINYSVNASLSAMSELFMVSRFMNNSQTL